MLDLKKCIIQQVHNIQLNCSVPNHKFITSKSIVIKISYRREHKKEHLDTIDHWSAIAGQRAGCGPRVFFMRPA